MDNPLKAELAKLIKKKAIIHGDFILSSGKRSSIYVDMRNITLHPYGAYIIGRLVFDLVVQLSPDVRAVAGPVFSGVPIATAVSILSFQKNLPIFALAVRDKAKEYGKQHIVEGSDNINKGDGVVIVDDVLTTGKSIINTSKTLLEQGFKVKGAVVLLDRRDDENTLKDLEIKSVFHLKELVQ